MLFAWLAWAVPAGRLSNFDEEGRAFVHQFAAARLTLAMESISWLDSTTFLIPMTALVVVLLVWRRRWRAAWLFLVVVAGAEVLEQVLKLFFHRARPAPFFDYPLPSGYSFPSGHAVLSVCFYGSLAVLLRARAGLWTTTAVLVALIGISRVYLGVHYPTDVIAGYAAGIVWVSLWDMIVR